MDKRFLLVENGIVVIHNEKGEEVVFDNMDDYYLYCGDYAIDLSNIDYLFYSINDDKNASDFNAAKTKSMPEVQHYDIEKNPDLESLIDNLMKFKEDLEDEFTGKPFEDMKKEQIEKVFGWSDGYIMLHYTNTEQTLMHSIYLDPTTDEEDKSDIESVGKWIRDIMRYRYDVIENIEKTSTVNELKSACDWDFEQFDKTDPKIDMKTLVR